MLNSFEPVINKDSRVLILGTMPGIKSLEKQEYYGNERNAFWKIIFSLFNKELTTDYEQRKEFLLQHNIALWDVLKSCDRKGSGDNEITNPVPNDFNGLFSQYPNIEAIYFNGEPAEKFFKKLVIGTNTDSGIVFHKLPSTSPANAVKFEQKLKYWKLILIMLEGLKHSDIQRLETFVGGFTGNSFEVKINFESLTGAYRGMDFGYELYKEKDLVLTEKSLILFIHMLYENRILYWNKRYEPDYEILDGTQWSVEVVRNNKTYHFSGNNKYPPQWKLFCKCIQRLVQEPFG